MTLGRANDDRFLIFGLNIPIMVFNRVRLHTHRCTAMHTLLHTCHSDIDWLYGPESESADTKEWKWSRMAEGFTLSVLTQHADRVAHTYTHTWPTPRQLRAEQTAEGWRVSCHGWCCCHILHWRSVGCTHTYKQCRQCTVFLAIFLSHCHCHTRTHCVFVCVCESMCYISYIMCVRVCAMEDYNTRGELSVSIHILVKCSCFTGSHSRESIRPECSILCFMGTFF